MATTADYLTQLQADKQTLVDNLVAKGVEASNDETFTTLAPKVAEISSGGGNEIEINDARYLFYNGARKDYHDEILKLCKNLINTSYMYNKNPATSLDLSKIDTSKVENMYYMFADMPYLKTLDVSKLNTSSCKDFGMLLAFSKLTDVDISSWDMSNAENITQLFYCCYDLVNLIIGQQDWKKVKTINSTFYGLNKLTTLDLTQIETSDALTGLSSTFYGLKLITDLDLHCFEGSKIENVNQIFYNCNELTNLIFFNNLGKGYTRKSNNYSNYKLDLHDSINLTHDSLMDVINKLYDLNLTYKVADGGTLCTQQLILGATNIAKLTADEIAIATNKGWVVS